MGSLPGAGHFGRPREKRKWVSATLLLGIHTPSWHLLICFRPPNLPPLTEAFHSFCDWCHSGGGSWWTATHLTPLPISLQTETTGEENRQKKKKKCTTPTGSKFNRTDFILFFTFLKREKNEVTSMLCWLEMGWPMGPKQTTSQLVGCGIKGMERGMRRKVVKGWVSLAWKRKLDKEWFLVQGIQWTLWSYRGI